jgi:H/ACA ribonucleoprotein complex non-core subunit NAF1
MATEMQFAVPSMIPQDLQIIQDLIGEIPVPPPSKATVSEHTPQRRTDDDSVDSSDNESDTNSELEVEANILGKLDSDEEAASPTYVYKHSATAHLLLRLYP